jgi:YVTN family beta-propeller protein
MEFRVPGPLEVVDEGRVLELGSGRQLALVASLLLHANEPVSVDRIVDELWGEAPPPTAAKIVRNNVSLLRKELGDRLVTRPPGYLLVVHEGELDSARFEHAVQSGTPDDVTAALALWRGPPLAQFAYESFAQGEIARLEELRLVAIEARIDAELELGRHRALIPELETLVQQHPLRESLCSKLMLAYYRSGRQADALEAYRRARLRSSEELGIEPGPELRELERRILNHDESLAARPSPEQHPATARRRRRPFLVAAAAALVLASIAAVAAVAMRDDGGLSHVPPNYVGVIDPKTNDVVAAVPVGIRPRPVASSSTTVWVGNLTDRSITSIDPVTRTPGATVALDDRTPTGLAVGPRAVWVAHGRGGELSRVEPQFRTTTTIEVTTRPYAAPAGAVALGHGHVWAVYGDSTLARIEPGTLRVSGTTLAGARPTAVVVGGGAVWVANAGDATVQRFDPVTFAEGPIWTINVGRRPTALAYGDGAVWVANEGDDTVTRIDTATRATHTIPVGDAPTALSFADAVVWVANTDDGTVSRIDASTRGVRETIELGNPAAGIVAAGGVVWVAVQAP